VIAVAQSAVGADSKDFLMALPSIQHINGDGRPMESDAKTIVPVTPSARLSRHVVPPVAYPAVNANNKAFEKVMIRDRQSYIAARRDRFRLLP
jgi:hypothetical protein